MEDYVFMYVTLYTPQSLGDKKIIIFIENKQRECEDFFPTSTLYKKSQMKILLFTRW